MISNRKTYYSLIICFISILSCCNFYCTHRVWGKYTLPAHLSGPDYEELILPKDSTFRYTRYFDILGKHVYEGTWKRDGNQLILCEYQDSIESDETPFYPSILYEIDTVTVDSNARKLIVFNRNDSTLLAVSFMTANYSKEYYDFHQPDSIGFFTLKNQPLASLTLGAKGMDTIYTIRNPWVQTIHIYHQEKQRPGVDALQLTHWIISRRSLTLWGRTPDEEWILKK